MENQLPTVVIDNGSENVRAGFAADDAPRANFPNVLGKYKMPSIMIGQDIKVLY